MTTDDDFQQVLDANPEDRQTYLVLADWLQERGDERAEGYRALGVLRRFPLVVGERAVYLCELPGARYSECVNLPEDWYTLVGTWRWCASRREADDVAALAFSDLPESRRAGLLATRS